MARRSKRDDICRAAELRDLRREAAFMERVGRPACARRLRDGIEAILRTEVPCTGAQRCFDRCPVRLEQMRAGPAAG
jgi:hypothetical protein